MHDHELLVWAVVWSVAGVIAMGVMAIYTRWMLLKEKAALPQTVVNTLFTVLGDKKNIKSLQSMLLDEEFLEAMGAMIIENVKNYVSKSIIGSKGGAASGDARREKAIGAALQSDAADAMGIGSIIELLPEKSKIGKLLRERPEWTANIMRIALPYIQQFMSKQGGGTGMTNG